METTYGAAAMGSFVQALPALHERLVGRGEAGLRVIQALELYEPITLAEMDRVALMSRIDVKYLLDTAQLIGMLEALADDYQVLEVAGARLSRYSTLYFDTDNLDLYAAHHMGKAERYKVRSRTYLESGISFLEVKRKTNKGRTVKDRIKTAGPLARLTPEAVAFVESVVPSNARLLQPVLRNEFSRITLVSKRRPERVTLDLDVRFRGAGSRLALGPVAIVEVKQEGRGRESELAARARALGARPMALSKYCIGTALLYPSIKHNRFKPALLAVDHIMRGGRRG